MFASLGSKADINEGMSRGNSLNDFTEYSEDYLYIDRGRLNCPCISDSLASTLSVITEIHPESAK